MAWRTEWLVPGMLKEKAHLLLKSLPQKLRRHCVPLPEYAAAFAARQGHRTDEPLLDVLIADVREHAGTVCQRADFKLETLPAHLAMNFKVIDEHGRQLGMGRNLAQLRAELGEEIQSSFRTAARADLAVAQSLQADLRDWDFGELPELMQLERARGRRSLGDPGGIPGAGRQAGPLRDRGLRRCRRGPHAAPAPGCGGCSACSCANS